MYWVVNSLVAQVYGTAPRAPVHCQTLTVTPSFCKIFLFNSILFIFESDGGAMRGKMTTRTLKILTETRFVKPIPIYDTFIILVKRCRWQNAVTDPLGAHMATGLQGTDNPVGLPNVCLICLLLSSRRISHQHQNRSCRLGFGLSQQ